MIKRILTYKYAVVSLVTITISVMFMQNISDISFLKNEIIYLASPYYDFKGITKSMVFLLSYLSAALLIWLSIYVRSGVVWLGMLLLVAAFNWVDIFIQLASNNRGFTKFEYSLVLAEIDSYKNMAVFLGDILRSFIYVLLFSFLLIYFRKKSSKNILTYQFNLLVICVFASIYGAAQGVFYIKYPSYPAIVKIPLIISAYHSNKKEDIPRILDENIFPNIENSKNNNIVWIIDESIGGKYLSLNGFDKNTTPYLESLNNSEKFRNYGVVNSVANCSATSNLMMRIGLSSHTKNADKDYVGTRIKLPTIYQYAKRAGYKTWLFDAQADEGQIQNYISPYDLKSIDEYVTLDTRSEDHLRDELALEELSKAYNGNKNGKNLFIFVKDGAHWPYLWRYPKNKEIFKPVQDTIYEEKTLSNKHKLINTYSNVIKYAVDDFFAKYIKKIDIDNTITFYTSDHGQHLLEEEGKLLTHCSTSEDSPVSEAEVPLFIIGINAKELFPVNKNKLYSQYQIFPTILSIMGYENDIISNYGETLYEGQPLNSKRWFYWGLEGGRSPYYNE